jgi:predicted  nucleic acid-binding Zn-ribbon protein
MNQMLGFIRLQLIDNRLDQITVRLYKIKIILEDDAELKQILDIKNKIEERMASCSKDVQTLELAVQDQQIKVQQIDASLYSGNFKNPKELQELQLEMASTKRFLSSLENKLLEAMIAYEDNEKEYDCICSKHNEIMNAYSIKNSEYFQENNTLQSEVDKLNVEKKAAESTLSTQEIFFYNQLRLQRGGIAVSSISDRSCDSCGTTLTPAQEQSIRSSDQLVHCPSCGRMLYAS